jgi:truncated hemoglobin YjbI
MLTYAMLAHQPRQLQALTTLRPEEFEALLEHFAAAWAATQSDTKTQAGQPRQRQAGGGRPAKLASPADKLLFILVYAKTYPLQTAHGLMFGLSQAQTNAWLHRLQPVLASALEQAGYAPERDAELGPARALQLDGTERPRQRPQDPTRWRTHYSGKKTPHG